MGLSIVKELWGYMDKSKLIRCFDRPLKAENFNNRRALGVFKGRVALETNFLSRNPLSDENGYLG